MKAAENAQKLSLFPSLLWISIAMGAILLFVTPVFAVPMRAERCAKIAAAVVGLNYHRQDTAMPDRAQVWQFGSGGKLQIHAVADFGKLTTEKKIRGHWKFEFEDQSCVLKTASAEQPSRWLSFRLHDVTWAIVDVSKWSRAAKGEEKHIPDFEDHSGIKTRFCGTGDRCERLWK